MLKLLVQLSLKTVTKTTSTYHNLDTTDYVVK